MGDTKRGRERKGRDKRAQTEQRLIQRDLNRHRNGSTGEDPLTADEETLSADVGTTRTLSPAPAVNDGIPAEFALGDVFSLDDDS